MTPELKSRIQISLVILLLLAGARVAYIFHERSASAPSHKAEDEGRALTPDEYVVPRKVYAHDLPSAKGLEGNDVWVKQGYGNIVYPVVNNLYSLDRGAALLNPIEKLSIRKVVFNDPPRSWGAPAGEQELMAICQRVDGSQSLVAVRIGSLPTNGHLSLIANDVFYFQDPHQLYRHWPAHVWKAIDAHQARPGMNELQVNFALGVPQSTSGGDYGDRTLVYANGGAPISVSFSNNKATEITPVKK
jgi:hypothetical protein